jgi:hypothetical protein
MPGRKSASSRLESGGRTCAAFWHQQINKNRQCCFDAGSVALRKTICQKDLRSARAAGMSVTRGAAATKKIYFSEPLEQKPEPFFSFVSALMPFLL